MCEMIIRYNVYEALKWRRYVSPYKTGNEKFLSWQFFQLNEDVSMQRPYTASQTT